MPKRTPEYLAARRERILEAALACFAEKGFHQTSIDDIAHSAKCGKSAIYAHFSSKREIIEALTEREVQHYEAKRPRDLPQFEQYVADSLENLQTPRMRQFSQLSLRIAAESLTDPAFLDWEERLFKRYIEWVEPLVRNDPAAADLSDRQVRDAARRLVFFWAGQALYRMFMPSFPPALLRADMAAVAPAIIQSVRGAARPSRRKSSAKRAAAAREQPVAVRRGSRATRR